MQSIAGIGSGLFRIVFRGGSPQRIPYTNALMIGAVIGLLAITVAAAVVCFRSSIIETGLALFTLVCGLYLGTALLTRRVPRSRLRVSLQSMLLLLSAGGLLLLLTTPLTDRLPGSRIYAACGIALAVLAGTTNVLHFALGQGRGRAAMMGLAFFGVLGAFYAVLAALLETTFT